MKKIMNYIYLLSANKVWGKVMFYSCYFCPRGYAFRGMGFCLWRNGVCIWGGDGWAYAPGSACKRFWADPLHTWDTTGYGQQAGGTHPPGMHTCSQCFYCTNHLENNKHNKLAGLKSPLKTRNVIRVNKTLSPYNTSFRIEYFNSDLLTT